MFTPHPDFKIGDRVKHRSGFTGTVCGYHNKRRTPIILVDKEFPEYFYDSYRGSIVDSHGVHIPGGEINKYWPEVSYLTKLCSRIKRNVE